MNRAYFITATGTDLGKTWLTAGLVAAMRARGVPVRAVKPVLSGYAPARHAESDLALLQGNVGAQPTAWTYAAPLSPDLAAAKEGKSIDFAALVDWCRSEIAAHEGTLLIEGIGGAMVPLDARHTVRDWIAALGIPTLLVCGTYLGSLSHTLSALAALREVGIVPAALVVNESAAGSIGVQDTLFSLKPHVGEIPLVVLRRDEPEGLAPLADQLLA